jgi:predicted XRE-type DNA-binding protein
VPSWPPAFIRVLDKHKLSVRKAATLTGTDAGDFSRIRQAELSRFTVDRLMTILARLDQMVSVRVDVKPRRTRVLRSARVREKAS